MKRRSRIRVAGQEVGLFPQSLVLNPRFRPEVQRIKLDVEVDWEPDDRKHGLGALEKSLVEISPNLRQHDCYGQSAYRILRGLEPGHDRSNREMAQLETPLAIAHLLEHLMIDTVATLTKEPLISGATGARWDSRHRFDIFVECPDVAVAPLAVRLAVSWMRAVMAGRNLDGAGPPTLELAHRIYARSGRGLNPTTWARRHRQDPGRVASALHWLEKNGFVRREQELVYFETEPTRKRPRGKRT